MLTGIPVQVALQTLSPHLSLPVGHLAIEEAGHAFLEVEQIPVGHMYGDFGSGQPSKIGHSARFFLHEPSKHLTEKPVGQSSESEARSLPPLVGAASGLWQSSGAAAQLPETHLNGALVGQMESLVLRQSVTDSTQKPPSQRTGAAGGQKVYLPELI